MVDYINSVPKYVVSTTLEEPLQWNNSTLIRTNAAEEIARLKRQPGEDITILGSGALVRSLLRGGLIDELRLMVHPIVLGGGKRLFEDGNERQALELVDSKTFDTGVLYLTYQPPGSCIYFCRVSQEGVRTSCREGAILSTTRSLWICVW
jgi:dihydrofolate reductase